MDDQETQIEIELARLVPPHASTQNVAAPKHLIDVGTHDAVGI
jgi:hypothetical protein